MNTEIIGIVLIYLLAVLAAIPLGKYIAKIFLGSSSCMDRLFNPIDRVFFRCTGIDPKRPMNWKQQLTALLTINLIWVLVAGFVLMNMSWLPLNPDGNPSMSPDLAFNTAISFVTNTNLQHYSGETGLSYLGQLVLMLWQFVSAATGIAICGAVFIAMRKDASSAGANFYYLFVRSCTRLLLPLSLVLATLLVFQGVPMNFAGKAGYVSLEGDTVQVSRGPAAAMIAIKQLGTNGGGYYGANAAHPLENPNYLTNIAENLAILLISIAMVLAMGHVIGNRRFSRMVFYVMTVGFLLLAFTAVYQETRGNPALAQMGIAPAAGNMEGKEVRFGAAATAFWTVSTTATSNGSVNAMHDSLMPLSIMAALLGMMVNAFYGGVGVGFLNFYLFIIIAVFISGLMVGRTPEFLGKKIEAREMKIAALLVLLHPLLILAGTALCCRFYTPAAGWLHHPGYHGFSEMLYEFTSAAANNGSGMEGLGDNTPFWNVACGIVMLLARYLPIIGPVAIAGLLTSKRAVPETAGTLRTDTATFGVMLFAVLFIVAALSFFPALTLGPVAEYFGMK